MALVSESLPPDDLEALRLNLGQIAAAPDVWRARAVSAGGFLGAAAAVSLWGVSQQAARLDGPPIYVAGAASLLYVLAVIGFLAASVMPAPQMSSDVEGGIADQLHAHAHKETKPIKRLVLAASALGCAAIIATTVASFLVLIGPTPSTATVSITDDARRASVERMCPEISDPFRARVFEDGTENLRLRVVDGGCGHEGSELLVTRGEIVRLEIKDR